MQNLLIITRNISRKVRLSEISLALSGFFVLLSVVVLSLGGGLALWIAAKVLYAVGVIIFVITKNSHVRG